MIFLNCQFLTENFVVRVFLKILNVDLPMKESMIRHPLGSFGIIYLFHSPWVAPMVIERFDPFRIKILRRYIKE